MKRSILLLLAFAILSLSSIGQHAHYITIGPDLSIPTGNLGSSTASIGGSVQYQVKFTGSVAPHLHIGYAHFKDQFGGKVRFLPVRAGIVCYLYHDLIFVNADAGVSRYYSPTTTTKQNGFSFGAGAGYRLFLGDKPFVQVSAYYNLHNFRNNMFGQNYNYSWVNIRAAFGLSFGKKKLRKEE